MTIRNPQREYAIGADQQSAITPANVPDAQGFRHVCPTQGAIYSDKGYCTASARRAAAPLLCYLTAISRHKKKPKNRNRDRWYSHLRAPYARIFSQSAKRVRYREVAAQASGGPRPHPTMEGADLRKWGGESFLLKRSAHVVSAKTFQGAWLSFVPQYRFTRLYLAAP